MFAVTFRRARKDRFCYGYGLRNNIAEEIRQVLDRYARRYGALTGQSAEPFEHRLANRESGCPETTLRALECSRPLRTKYPRSKAAAHERLIWASYLAPEGPYTDESDFNSYRQKFRQALKRREDREMRGIARDEANLIDCRRFIRQTLEFYRESTKNNRATS